eukprot:jgi/Botrbrau1/18738/Bobra.0386s0061.1
MVATRSATDVPRRSSLDRRRHGDPQALDKTHRGSIDKGSRGDSTELRQQRRQQALDAVLEQAGAEAQSAHPGAVEVTRSRRRKSINLHRGQPSPGGPHSPHAVGSTRWHRWVLEAAGNGLGLPESATSIVDSLDSTDMKANVAPTRRRAAIELSRSMSIATVEGEPHLPEEGAGSRNPSNDWNFKDRRRQADEEPTRMSVDEEDHFLPPELLARSALFAGEESQSDAEPPQAATGHVAALEPHAHWQHFGQYSTGIPVTWLAGVGNATQSSCHTGSAEHRMRVGGQEDPPPTAMLFVRQAWVSLHLMSRAWCLKVLASQQPG